jgi:hypothetical protein
MYRGFPARAEGFFKGAWAGRKDQMSLVQCPVLSGFVFFQYSVKRAGIRRKRGHVVAEQTQPSCGLTSFFSLVETCATFLVYFVAV